MVMSITSGTSFPARSDANYTIVKVVVGLPTQLVESSDGKTLLENYIVVEPVFLDSGIVTDPSSLDVSIDIEKGVDGFMVMIKGKQPDLAMTLSLRKLLDSTLLGEAGQYEILRLVPKKDPVKCDYKIGDWRAPVVALDFDDAKCPG